MTIAPVEDQSEKHIQHSIWFRLVQVLWFVCAIAAAGLILSSLFGYWQHITEVTFIQFIDSTSVYMFSMNLIAALTSIFAALVSFLLAVVLFWRKADEVMALFMSFFLLGYSVILAGPLEVILDHFGIVTPLMMFTSPAQWFRLPILEIAVLFIILLGVYAQVFRYRNVSAHSERQQTKWVLFGSMLFVLMILVSYPFFIAMNNMQPGDPLPWWLPMNNILWWLTMCIMPVTIFIAIQRHNLWDIDIIIRRTLVYGALTLMLVVVYFASVVLLQQAFRALTGQDSPVAIVISTLIIAALFNPLRGRVQKAIDHRFYRRKYDAQQALAEFAATARDEVELEQLTGHLLSVVQEAMQPEHVNLWLSSRQEGRDS
jgi:hypothetical protein